MFIKILKRTPFSRMVTFFFACTLTVGLLLVVTNTLIGHESDNLSESEKSEALEKLCQLPNNDRNRISWGYVGAYQTAPGKTNQRIVFYQDDLEHFLSKASDADIVNLVSIFTDKNVIAVLRQLIEGKKSVADLAKESNTSEDEIEKAVASLIDSKLAERTEDNLIAPKNDVGSFFLNFLSMTIVHKGNIKSDD